MEERIQHAGLSRGGVRFVGEQEQRGLREEEGVGGDWGGGDDGDAFAWERGDGEGGRGDWEGHGCAEGDGADIMMVVVVVVVVVVIVGLREISDG